jgi:ABC-type dipeptide/oligopeptide/nickel transport system permease component
MQFSPVDPVVTLLGENYTPEQAELMRTELGLDKSVPEQYLRWLGRVVRGDFGRSYQDRAQVVDLIKARLTTTLLLAAISVVFSLLFAIPVGVISAVNRGKLIDDISRYISLTGVSIPIFWLGLLLMYFFSYKFRLLPAGGSIELVGLRALVLPSISLGASFVAILARLTRSTLLEVLAADYVRTARGKGLTEGRVVYRHALRNALLPVITMSGMQLGTIMGGAVLTESVFSLPGLGSLLVESIFAKDFPVLQACVLIICLAFILANLLVDLAYGLLDPRVR